MKLSIIAVVVLQKVYRAHHCLWEPESNGKHAAQVQIVHLMRYAARDLNEPRLESSFEIANELPVLPCPHVQF